MLKMIGAMCVIGGSIGFGMAGAGQLRAREETLGELCSAFAWLEEELSFSLTPLPDLLERLGQSRSGQVGEFFAQVSRTLKRAPEEGFRGAWRVAASGCCLGVLREEELCVVMGLGDTLGRYDAKSQCQALRLAGGRLEKFRQRAGEERSRLGRVYMALSVAAGLAAVLVLV